MKNSACLNTAKGIDFQHFETTQTYPKQTSVIPAQAGIQADGDTRHFLDPAFVGMMARWFKKAPEQLQHFKNF